MLWDILYDYVLPGFLITVMGGVVLLAKPLTDALTKWLAQRGIVVEESRQRMFQTGLENAADAVIRRAGGGKITDFLLNHGVRHMHSAVPDQIEHFRPTDEQIKVRVADRVDRKLREQGVDPADVIVPTETPSRPAAFTGRASGRSEVRP